MKKTYIVTVNEIFNRPDQHEKPKASDNLIFLSMCLSYLVLLFTGVVDPTHPIGLFMAFFSLNISICFSDNIAKNYYKAFLLKLLFPVKNIGCGYMLLYWQLFLPL